MSSTLFYVKQANTEHFRPGLRAHSMWRMCPLKPLQSCRNLHTTTLRARYSQCGIWAGTCADIRSHALRLGLLAPANSARLISLRSVTVRCCCWQPQLISSPTNSMDVSTTTVRSGYDQPTSPAHHWWLSSGRDPATQHG